jgi:serine protease
LTNSSGRLPGQRADVINLSLGASGSCDAILQQVISAARNAGSVIVAAAGNENTSRTSIPASCDGVISVSALDANRTRAPYSNFGATVDVAAPGGDVRSDRDGDGNPDGVYSTYSSRSDDGTYSSTHAYLMGTSMASPHMAGVIALMKSVNPALTPAIIDRLLNSGALTDDIGAPGRDNLGVGAINAVKAVRAASTNTPIQPARLGVIPTSINFGDALGSSDVAVSNVGGGTISVTATAVSDTWLTVTPVQVDAAGLGTYRVQVNRAGLANGVYNGRVDFRSSPTEAVRVTVLMQVASTTVTPDAGQHYLLLIDPATGDTRDQVDVLARGSAVNFSFTGVAPGQYELVAGTDLNNDGFICDDGEACAEYPVYGERVIIDASADVNGLSLATTFHANAVAESAASVRERRTRTGFRRLR